MQCFLANDLRGAVKAFEQILPVIAHERRSGSFLISLRKEILRHLNVIRHAAVRHPTATLSSEARAGIPGPGTFHVLALNASPRRVLIVESSRLNARLLQSIVSRSHPSGATIADRGDVVGVAPPPHGLMRRAAARCAAPGLLPAPFRTCDWPSSRASAHSFRTAPNVQKCRSTASMM
jgi:hypothetical protein